VSRSWRFSLTVERSGARIGSAEPVLGTEECASPAELSTICFAIESTLVRFNIAINRIWVSTKASRELWDRVQAKLNSNLQTRHTRVRERASSLLTGLLYDSRANRFTPSFTIKSGRRYRYYVSQVAIKNPASQHKGPLRLPAHEIESWVTERLRSFLNSDADVFEELGIRGETPATLQRLVTAARELAERWAELRSGELRGLVRCIVKKVIVREDSMELLVSRKNLRRVLETGQSLISDDERKEGTVDEADSLHLTVQAKLNRCGGELHLVVPPNSPGNPRQSTRKCT
jgi:site-specific DNA recombinase